MAERKYKVPAKWMRVTWVGAYSIVPKINAACEREYPTERDLFYRVMHRSAMVSDHGDRQGAVSAARRYGEADKRRAQ
jgi:hypothetical protein